MKTIAQVTRNIGVNKGRPRLWLEKKILLDTGFNHKLPYSVHSEAGLIRITLDEAGIKKVAGSPERPVIDLLGGLVATAFGDKTITPQVTVTCERKGELIVRAAS